MSLSLVPSAPQAIRVAGRPPARSHSDTPAAGGARPFLKWAGGKKQLLPHILPVLPRKFGRYYEPFVGGGAVFFALTPPQAALSDVNGDLIDTYRALQRHVEAVIAGLASLDNDPDTFYCLRAMSPRSLSLPARAARFIYMNRTCYNGLYRVNRGGAFNVPFGRYARPTICDADNLRAVSSRLQHVSLSTASFERTVSSAAPGDLVYFDPPYVPVSATANFVQYAKGGFDLGRQARLAALFARLARRGVHVALSNADTPLVRQLYAGFRQITLQARRQINCRAGQRGPVPELLVLSH